MVLHMDQLILLQKAALVMSACLFLSQRSACGLQDALGAAAAAHASNSGGPPELLLPHGGPNALTSSEAGGSREAGRPSSMPGVPSMHVVPRQGLQRRTGGSAATVGTTSVSDDTVPPLTGSHSESQLSEFSEEPASLARGQDANALMGLESGPRPLVPASVGEGGSGGPDPSGGAPLAGAGRPAGLGFQLLDSFEANRAEAQALEISDTFPAGLVGGALGEAGGRTQQASFVFMLAAPAKHNVLPVHKLARPTDCVDCHTGATPLVQLGCRLYYIKIAV